MKLSSKVLLAMAISSITATAYAEPASQEFVPTTLAGASAQSEAKGFIEDFSLGGQTRNWYSHESLYRGGSWKYQKHGKTLTDRNRTNWVQGTILNASSGFTQGTVGVKTELAVYNALVLDRSKRDIKG
eukprot:gene17717-17555_t